jgi:hypothetical protein
LDKLEELGIIAIRKFLLAMDLGDEDLGYELEEVADASSGRVVKKKQGGKKKTKYEEIWRI